MESDVCEMRASVSVLAWNWNWDGMRSLWDEMRWDESQAAYVRKVTRIDNKKSEWDEITFSWNEMRQNQNRSSFLWNGIRSLWDESFWFHDQSRYEFIYSSVL